MSFMVTDHKGVHIKFSNGWAISVQWGPYNYCEVSRSSKEPVRENYWKSEDAEVAIFVPGDGKGMAQGGFLPLRGDDVEGHVTPDTVAKLMATLAAFPTDLDRKRASNTVKAILAGDEIVTAEVSTAGIRPEEMVGLPLLLDGPPVASKEVVDAAMTIIIEKQEEEEEKDMAKKMFDRAYLAKTLPPLNNGEDVPLDDKIVPVKFFSPIGGATWYLTEYEEADDLAFGFVTLSGHMDDQNAEWGYVSLAELESIRLPMGLTIERDLHWTPTRFGEIKGL